jgi:ATP adenylyltransferase/5',5'''-P-1,P-4-tetraphosphate phosphorylase II
LSYIIQKILSASAVDLFVEQNNYTAAADYLFNSQMNSWQLMRKNYDALIEVQKKDFWFEGFKIKVQFNPERIKSTAAKVDAKSVADRKCFLCIDNLPEEQKGIPIFDSYFLLCNPYPVFPQHFTISSLEQEPQRISSNFSDLLEITKLLSPSYTLVYNGPECGASAPDHLHFQSGTKLFVPIENDIHQLKNDYGKIVLENETISVSFIDDDLRKLILMECVDKSELENIFYKILTLLRDISSGKLEPMINIICKYDNEFGWSVIVFLRGKHRPERFFAEGTEKILVSPAAIDLGGVLVTPREEDFIKLNKEIISSIFKEVSLDQENFSILYEKLKKELN